jgi:hypothetical protein
MPIAWKESRRWRDPADGRQAERSALIVAEIDKWAKVVRFAGVKVE